MKRTISLFLVFTLIFQITSVSFATDLNHSGSEKNEKSMEKEIEELNEKKENAIEIIREQLEDQDMIVHLPIYEEIINDEYTAKEIEIKSNYSNSPSTRSIKAASSTVKFPKGGHVSYPVTGYGNGYGKIHRQYLAPKETKEIITRYRTNDLVTWNDLLVYMAGTGLSYKYPPISVAISIYGGSKLIDSFLTSEIIRLIQSGTNASSIITVETSYGKSSSWGVWDTYSSVSIPDYEGVEYVKY